MSTWRVLHVSNLRCRLPLLNMVATARVFWLLAKSIQTITAFRLKIVKRLWKLSAQAPLKKILTKRPMTRPKQLAAKSPKRKRSVGQSAQSVATRFRKLFPASRSCWFRWSKKSAATKARRSQPICLLPAAIACSCQIPPARVALVEKLPMQLIAND